MRWWWCGRRRAARLGPMTQQPLDTVPISIRGLTKRYGDRPALDGVDLEVHAGEIFALLGPNGAGKTTTIEILEGFRQRDAGDVSVLGNDPGKADRSWRARIGIVLQGTNDAADADRGRAGPPLRRLLSGAARPRRGDRGPSACETHRGNARPAAVRRPAAPARRGARHHRRPGAAVPRRADHGLRPAGPPRRSGSWSASLRDAGTTILLTTHYLDEAEQLADRVGVIIGGRIVAVGTVDDLGAEQRRTAVVSWRDEHGQHQPVDAGPDAVSSSSSRSSCGGPVPDLEVRRPDLEDVYLSMIAELPA